MANNRQVINLKSLLGKSLESEPQYAQDELSLRQQNRKAADDRYQIKKRIYNLRRSSIVIHNTITT
jgi:hypothetical protein